MASSHQLPEQYTVLQLARIFHKFPHFNGTLHIVNNTFNPYSEIYIESLGILASIPAALLIFTLLVLLIYLVTRCCDRKPRNRLSIILFKCSLAILALVCCATVAVGLYGNDDVHNGMVQLIAAAKNIDTSIMAVRNQSLAIELKLKKLQSDLTPIRDQLDAPVNNKTLMESIMNSLELMKKNTTLAINRSVEIRRPLSRISLAGAITLTEYMEHLRWPITMAILSALLILCVVLLVGVARHSRCALITFSVFGLFAVIISWLMASIYLSTAVALGDLCVSPDTYIMKTAPSALGSQVLSYYTHCENTRNNPYTQQLRDGKTAAENIRRNLDTIKQLSTVLLKEANLQAKFSSINSEIISVDNQFTSITTYLDCRPIYKQYVHAAKSLCHLGLFGLALMLLASVAAGFFFTVLVWVDSHTWIYIRKRSDYHQVEEQDPFLPPSAASQAIAARTLRGQGSYPPTAPPLTLNAHGKNNTIKKPLLHSPPPPSYATATSRARQMHESMSKGGAINNGGGTIDHHKSNQHNSQTLSRSEHRNTHVEQPGQFATLSKQCKTLEANDFY